MNVGLGQGQRARAVLLGIGVVVALVGGGVLAMPSVALDIPGTSGDAAARHPCRGRRLTHDHTSQPPPPQIFRVRPP